MEPPARRAWNAHRPLGADRPSLASAGPCVGLLCFALLTLGCAEPPGGADGPAVSQGPDLALADASLVAPGDEGTFDDLPGVEAFADLTPGLQSVVVDRANRTRCDCGCPVHSVNHCLHQEEDCEVALRLARSFVDDALSLQLQSEAAAPAASEDPTVMEPAEPDGLEESAGSTAP